MIMVPSEILTVVAYVDIIFNSRLKMEGVKDKENELLE